MQYVWQHRLWPPQRMQTVDGKRVNVLDPGLLNTDAGPDFFNAKIQIDGHTWAGDVEIHVRASDWHRHHHDNDPAYQSVILHVVDCDDTMIRRPDGQVIPQMLMPCSPTLNHDYSRLVDASVTDLPCAEALRNLPGIYLTDWLSALTFERMYAKSDRIDALRALNSGDSIEACYINLARALGFGTNADPFERLARAMPMRLLLKHRDSLPMVEAMLLGQSGLLNPYLADDEALAATPPYVQTLVREYRFLAAKFSLTPLQYPGWKMGRMRPANFPHRRIAYLAHLLHAVGPIHSALLDIRTVDDAYALFAVRLTGHWLNHYHFTDTPQPTEHPSLSRASINLLIINAVVPFIFNHGLHTSNERYTSLAIDLLSHIPGESNRIVRMFADAGIAVSDASVSQALIQLRRNYCEARKCLYCRLGHRHLSNCACRI